MNHRFKLLSIGILPLLLVVAVLPATAGLHEIDLVPCSGDDLLTLDTSTHREWLDLTATGHSYDELTGAGHDCNPTCTTGPLAGWTIASETDVLELLTNGGLTPYGTEVPGAASHFLELVEITGHFVGEAPTERIPKPGLKTWGRGFTRDLVSGSEVTGVEVIWGFTASDINFPPIEYASSGRPDVSRSTHRAGWLYRPYATAFPDAKFCASPLAGPAPLAVKFADKSIEATSWLWDFGDGGTSTTRHPTHTYASDGTYTVSLSVTGPGGADSLTKTDYISVLMADFTDVTNSLALANFDFSSVFVHVWLAEDDPTLYPLSRHWADRGTRRARDAVIQATAASGPGTSFWGNLAREYGQADLDLRLDAGTYLQMAVDAAAGGSQQLAEYYGAYANSIYATGNLYNGAALWCAAMESGVQAYGLPAMDPGTPSFTSAAYYAVLANLYMSTANAYSFLAKTDPAYYPLVLLYVTESYPFAETARDHAVAALATATGNSAYWGDLAVTNANKDLTWRSWAMNEFDLAVQEMQAGRLSAAEDHLQFGYYQGSGNVNLYNTYVIWLASLAAEGGAK